MGRSSSLSPEAAPQLVLGWWGVTVECGVCIRGRHREVGTEGIVSSGGQSFAHPRGHDNELCVVAEVVS